jgi:methylthioribose-1-phosphate isomerase
MGDTPEKEPSSRSQPADRRDFLRQIAKDGVKSASSLLGVVGAIRREAGELADNLRIEDPLADLVDDAPQPQRRAAEAALDLPLDAGLVPLNEETPAAAFASPVRDDAQGLILLDVRALPAQILERRADTPGALAAALAACVMAPGPIRALAAGLSLAAEDASDAPARPARIQAAAAALRNAAPLSDALRGEVSRLLAAAPGSLGQLVAAYATAQIVERAAQAERIAVALARCNSKGATVATGPGLGATFWGDNAPGHEGLRRAGVAQILIAEGPSVDPRGVTRLGGLDAADAVRINLPAELMSEAQLTLAIARGEACALLLASDAVAADGSAVVLAGGVALAAAAAARKIPILLVATSSSAASADAAALARRITEADETELHAAAGGSVASRSVAAGVTVHAPRYEILAAGVAERI